MLVSNKGEPSAKLHYKMFDFFHQSLFRFCFFNCLGLSPKNLRYSCFWASHWLVRPDFLGGFFESYGILAGFFLHGRRQLLGNWVEYLGTTQVYWLFRSKMELRTLCLFYQVKANYVARAKRLQAVAVLHLLHNIAPKTFSYSTNYGAKAPFRKMLLSNQLTADSPHLLHVPFQFSFQIATFPDFCHIGLRLTQKTAKYHFRTQRFEFRAWHAEFRSLLLHQKKLVIFCQKC